MLNLPQPRLIISQISPRLLVCTCFSSALLAQAYSHLVSHWEISGLFQTIARLKQKNIWIIPYMQKKKNTNLPWQVSGKEYTYFHDKYLENDNDVQTSIPIICQINQRNSNEFGIYLEYTADIQSKCEGGTLESESWYAQELTARDGISRMCSKMIRGFSRAESSNLDSWGCKNKDAHQEIADDPLIDWTSESFILVYRVDRYLSLDFVWCLMGSMMHWKRPQKYWCLIQWTTVQNVSACFSWDSAVLPQKVGSDTQAWMNPFQVLCLVERHWSLRGWRVRSSLVHIRYIRITFTHIVDRGLPLLAVSWLRARRGVLTYWLDASFCPCDDEACVLSWVVRLSPWAMDGRLVNAPFQAWMLAKSSCIFRICANKSCFAISICSVRAISGYYPPRLWHLIRIHWP